MGLIQDLRQITPEAIRRAIAEADSLAGYIPGEGMTGTNTKNGGNSFSPNVPPFVANPLVLLKVLDHYPWGGFYKCCQLHRYTKFDWNNDSDLTMPQGMTMNSDNFSDTVLINLAEDKTTLHCLKRCEYVWAWVFTMKTVNRGPGHDDEKDFKYIAVTYVRDQIFPMRITASQPIPKGGRQGCFQYAGIEQMETPDGWVDRPRGRELTLDCCDDADCASSSCPESSSTLSCDPPVNYCRYALNNFEGKNNGGYPLGPVQNGQIVEVKETLDDEGGRKRYRFWHAPTPRLCVVVGTGPLGQADYPEDDDRYWMQVMDIDPGGQNDPLVLAPVPPAPAPGDVSPCPPNLPRVVTVHDLAFCIGDARVGLGTPGMVFGQFDTGNTLRLVTALKKCDSSSSGGTGCGIKDIFGQPSDNFAERLRITYCDNRPAKIITLCCGSSSSSSSSGSSSSSSSIGCPDCITVEYTTHPAGDIVGADLSQIVAGVWFAAGGWSISKVLGLWKLITPGNSYSASGDSDCPPLNPGAWTNDDSPSGTDTLTTIEECGGPEAKVFNGGRVDDDANYTPFGAPTPGDTVTATSVDFGDGTVDGSWTITDCTCSGAPVFNGPVDIN